MPDPPPSKKQGILSEETVRRPNTADADDDILNPYWLDEEPDPHPNPELGCIRRNLCCRSAPGWFAPGEVEQAAASLEMSPDDFVRTYLVIDHIEVDGARVEVFVPAKLGRDNVPLIPPATRTDRLYQMLRSPCIFFNGDGCRIYTARPIECRSYDCTRDDTITHEAIARMWVDAAAADEG